MYQLWCLRLPYWLWVLPCGLLWPDISKYNESRGLKNAWVLGLAHFLASFGIQPPYQEAQSSLRTQCDQQITSINSWGFFWPCYVTCGILVPWPGIKTMLPAIEAWSLNHWSTRAVPTAGLLSESYTIQPC